MNIAASKENKGQKIDIISKSPLIISKRKL